MPIYEKIKSQFGDAADKIIPNWGDILLTYGYEASKNPFKAIGSEELAYSSQRTAAGFWLNDNEGYQNVKDKIDHLTDLTSNMPFSLKEPSHDTASYGIYKAMESGNIIPVSVIASISKADISSPTLDELIEKGLASCELKVAVVSEDNLENYSAVIPAPQLKAMRNGQGTVGYAREAVTSAYSEATANQSLEASPIENNVFVSVELDGEEIGNATNRVQARQYAMSNGR